MVAHHPLTASHRRPSTSSPVICRTAPRWLTRFERRFIVTDIISDWPMKDWDCASIQREYGGESMEAWNYGGEGPQSVQLKDEW